MELTEHLQAILVAAMTLVINTQAAHPVLMQRSVSNVTTRGQQGCGHTLWPHEEWFPAAPSAGTL